MYEFISARTQGADHIKHGLPCEDYGQVFESELCKIFVVADGHGDSNCPRSQFGSQKACEIAVSKMAAFCAGIKDNGLEAELLSAGKRREGRVRQLVSSIMAEWGRAVNADIEARPLTPEERAGCSKYIEKYDRGERLEHIYGTTLIAGLLTERYLLLLQQGDGRCVVFNSDGSASQPIPWDDKCFANVTTSLCDTDAVQRFRYSIIDLKENPVAACLAASDGVEDSFFSMDLMYSYCRDLLIYAQKNGVAALNRHLDETLPEFSRTGSGDDVTVSGIVDTAKIGAYVGVFERDNEIVRQESVIRDVEERLKSMNGMGKMDALKKKSEQSERELIEAKRIQEKANRSLRSFTLDSSPGEPTETGSVSLKDKFRRLFGCLEIGPDADQALRDRYNKLKENSDRAEARYQAASREYGEAERLKREADAAFNAYSGDLNRLKNSSDPASVWKKFKDFIKTYFLAPTASIDEILERRRSALQKAKEEADSRAEQLNAKYLAAKQEYDAFMTKKSGYEQRKAEAERRINELRNSTPGRIQVVPLAGTSTGVRNANESAAEEVPAEIVSAEDIVLRADNPAEQISPAGADGYPEAGEDVSVPDAKGEPEPEEPKPSGIIFPDPDVKGDLGSDDSATSGEDVHAPAADAEPESDESEPSEIDFPEPDAKGDPEPEDSESSEIDFQEPDAKGGPEPEEPKPSGEETAAEEASSASAAASEDVPEPEETSSEAARPEMAGNCFVASEAGNEYAYRDNPDLKYVIIPEGIASIGANAFDGCSGLTEIRLPKSITEIGDYAFASCSSLTAVRLPGGIKRIGKGAFSDCSGLTEIRLPGSVTEIGDSAFSGCSSLTDIRLPDGIGKIGKSVFYKCSSLKRIFIPDGVAEIGQNSFGECEGLTEAVIPDSVNTVKSFAFDGCAALKELHLPDGVASIGRGAFEGVKCVQYSGEAEGSPWGAEEHIKS